MELLIKKIAKDSFVLVLILLVQINLSFAQEKNSFLKLRELSSDYNNTEEILETLKSINTELENNTLDLKFYNLDDPKVIQGIEDAAEISEEVKIQLVNVLEKRLLGLLDTDESERLSETYSKILTLRPDPNELNNNLRMTIAIRASSQAAKEFAQGRIEELKYLGLFDQGNKFKLFTTGHYDTVRFVLIFSFFTILLIAILVLIERIFFYGKVKTYFAKRFDVKLDDISFHQTLRHMTTEKNPSDEHSSPRRDKNSRGYMRTVVGIDEYSKLLESFGLDDTASEDMIKKVYRQKLKQLHPDKNLATASEEELQSLKETYDRIMEIRSSWFGGRK